MATTARARPPILRVGALVIFLSGCTSRETPTPDTPRVARGDSTEVPTAATHDDYTLRLFPLLLDSARRTLPDSSTVLRVARRVDSAFRTVRAAASDSAKVLRAPLIGGDDERTLVRIARAAAPDDLSGALANATMFRALFAGQPERHDYQGARKPCVDTPPCVNRDFGPQVIAMAAPLTQLNDDADDYATPQLVAYVKFMVGNGRELPELGAKSGQGASTPENLIYLQYTGSGNARVWTAITKRTGSVSGTVPDIPVTRIPVAVSGGDTVPAVAAWHWDEEKELNLLGVRCGKDGWCIIGRDPTHPQTPPRPTLPKICEQSEPRCLIPGWGDTQRLAFRDDAKGELQASDARGAIVPARNLDAITDPAHYKDFALAATVRVDSDYSKRMKNGTMRVIFRKGVENRIYLKITDYTAPKPSKVEAKVVYKNASGVDETVGPFDGDRFDSKGLFTPPGAARWYWDPEDDGLWIRCAVGCCQVRVTLK